VIFYSEYFLTIFLIADLMTSYEGSTFVSTALRKCKTVFEQAQDPF